MRLNQSIKQAFIKSVLSDVPTTDYSELIRQRADQVAAENMPPKVRAVWDDKTLREALHYDYVYVGRQGMKLPVMGNRQHMENIVNADANIRGYLAAAITQNDMLAGLRTKLEAVIGACSTTKQLAEALPECAKYLPPEPVKGSQLPAIANLVADLMKAGWPKGKAEAHAAKQQGVGDTVVKLARKHGGLSQ
jgi:hypothetical protein